MKLAEFKRTRLNENTIKKTQSVFKLFSEWHSKWKVGLDGGLKVLKDLNEVTKTELNYLLECFFMELRKTDGSHYPPGTLKSYFFCIGYHCKNSFGKSWLVFKDKEFSGARDSLDAAMKSSARNGYLLPKKRARSISMKEEDSL